MIPSRFCCILLLGCPALLAAQDSMHVRPGSHVRVQVASSRRLTGELLSIAGDTMRIARCELCTPVAVPTQHIESLEVRTGKYVSGRHILVGALIGLAIGTAYGTIMAERDLHGCRDGPCGLAALDVPVLGVGGTLLGAVGGGIWRADRWVRVPVRDSLAR
jgi:hypothetical protein